MKTEIEKKVNKILENAKTQKEFLDSLRAYDLHYYERKFGQPTGIVHENSKFRFSSLDMDIEKFKALPLDMTEEQKALKEIEDIREQRQDKSLHRILEFEENGTPKTISYNMEMKTESWRDAEGESHDIESELTTNEYLKFERINAIMNEYPDRFDKDEPESDKEPELKSDNDLDAFVEHLNSSDDIDIEDNEPDQDKEDDKDIEADNDFDR